jgi:putative SOS response-associated peptidase YedK
MCGRYALVNGKKVFLNWEIMRKLRKAGIPFEILPNFNALPRRDMPIVLIRNGELRVEKMNWWLMPGSIKSNEEAKKWIYTTFNARDDKIETSKVFAPFFKNGQRCLIPAEAFYEVLKAKEVLKALKEKRKKPDNYRMLGMMKDQEPFMMAGLYSIWKEENVDKKTGEINVVEHPTFSIITTKPNDLIGYYHDRMPVILDEKDFDAWLDPFNKDYKPLKKLLVPYPATKMKAYLVVKPTENSKKNFEPAEDVKDIN